MLAKFELFKVEEEKCLVLLNRTADVASELVSLKGRPLQVEEVARIHYIISQEFEHAAVERIGSAFRRDGHLSAFATPAFGVVRVGLDLEFLDFVYGWLVYVGEHVVGRI